MIGESISLLRYCFASQPACNMGDSSLTIAQGGPALHGRVVQAPWRMPGADPADFFNYGLNINTWKEYVARIHQFRLEFSMQKKIQTYESSNDAPALDPDLPPELAAAVAQGRQQVYYLQLKIYSNDDGKIITTTIMVKVNDNDEPLQVYQLNMCKKVLKTFTFSYTAGARDCIKQARHAIYNAADLEKRMRS